jgi:hypothetical protein
MSTRNRMALSIDDKINKSYNTSSNRGNLSKPVSPTSTNHFFKD